MALAGINTDTLRLKGHVLISCGYMLVDLFVRGLKRYITSQGKLFYTKRQQKNGISVCN